MITVESPAASPRPRDRLMRIVAALMLLAYAAWLVSLHKWAIAHRDWGWLMFSGGWLAVLFIVAACGVLAGREWARRMGTALAALPVLLTPMILVAMWSPTPLWLFPHLAMWPAGVAALVLLLRAAPRTARHAVPAVVPAFGLEVVMLGVAGVLNRAVVTDLTEVTQLPGSLILRAMDYDMVFTDYNVGPWGMLTTPGIPVIAVANTIALIPLVLLARSIRRRIGRRAIPRPAVPYPTNP